MSELALARDRRTGNEVQGAVVQADPARRTPWLSRPTNLPIGWTKTFTNPRLCAAIVDRLTFGGNIIEAGTPSFRLAHAKAQLAAG